MHEKRIFEGCIVHKTLVNALSTHYISEHLWIIMALTKIMLFKLYLDIHLIEWNYDFIRVRSINFVLSAKEAPSKSPE